MKKTSVKVGFLHSLIRREEKLLLEALAARPGVELVLLDDREIVFQPGRPGGERGRRAGSQHHPLPGAERPASV